MPNRVESSRVKRSQVTWAMVVWRMVAATPRSVATTLAVRRPPPKKSRAPMTSPARNLWQSGPSGSAAETRVGEGAWSEAGGEAWEVVAEADEEAWEVVAEAG